MLDYRKQIIRPILISSCILGAAFIALFYSAYHFIQINRLDNDIDNVRYQIVILENAIVKTEAGQRGYLLTNSITFVNTFEQGRQDIQKILKALRLMQRDFQAIKPSLDKVEQLINQSLYGMDNSIQIQMNSGSYAPHLNSEKIGGNQLVLIDQELKHADDLLSAQKAGIHAQIEGFLRITVLMAMILTIMIVIVLISGSRRTLHLFELAAKSQLAADEFSHDAYHDVLTSLPNRRYFEEHVKSAFALARRNHYGFALLVMDLDGFKFINDQYGHDTGDEALKYVARQIQPTLRESDFLARLGGDEFAIVVQGASELEALSGLSMRVLDCLREPFIANGYECRLGVSIGIGIYPDHGLNVEALMSAADGAMYQAKRTGKNKVIFALNLPKSA